MRKCPYCGDIGEALRAFRFQLSRDPYISDDTRITVTGHLDTPLLENEDEDV